MKRIVISGFIILIFATTANALGINYYSELHHIWGYAGASGSPGMAYYEYDIMLDAPVNAYVEGIGPGVIPETFEPNYSGAAAGDFNISLEMARWDACAYGESYYVFSPEYEQIEISAFGSTSQTHFHDTLSIALYDLTNGVDVYDFSFEFRFENGLWFQDFTLNETISVKSDHIYQLYMYAEATGGDMPAESELTCNLSSVRPIPEPSTLFLLCVGIPGIIVRRKASKLSKS